MQVIITEELLTSQIAWSIILHLYIYIVQLSLYMY